VAVIQDEMLSAKPLTYDRVLALDTKLRTAELPPLLKYKAPIPAEHAADSLSITWRRAFFAVQIHCCASYASRDLGCSHRRAVTLQLHRSYWNIATRDYAADPLGSPYGPSVTIAIRSASALLAIADATYEYMVRTDADVRAVPSSPPAKVFPATRLNCGNEAISIGMVRRAPPRAARRRADGLRRRRSRRSSRAAPRCPAPRTRWPRWSARSRPPRRTGVRTATATGSWCAAGCPRRGARPACVLTRVQRRMADLCDLARAVCAAHAAPAGTQSFRPSAAQIEATLAAPAVAESGGPAAGVPAETVTFFDPVSDELGWPPAYVDLGNWPSSGSESSERLYA
jgi:hypothetical protein